MKELLDNPLVKYTAIAVAIACLISPDPFSDVFAFWLLAKVGASETDKSISKWFKASSYLAVFGLAYVILIATTFAT